MSIATNGINDTAKLEAALTDSDPIVRILARAAHSEWMEGLQAFVNDEIRRNDTIMVLQALAQLQISIHSGLASQLLPAAAIPTVVKAYERMLRSFYEEHAALARQSLPAGRARP